MKLYNNLYISENNQQNVAQFINYNTIIEKLSKDGIPATVAAIEYDPNRTANIALLVYADGEKRYIIAPNGTPKRRIDNNFQ